MGGNPKENSGKGPIQGASRQYFNKFWWLEGGEKGRTEEVSRWSTRRGGGDHGAGD